MEEKVVVKKKKALKNKVVSRIKKRPKVKVAYLVGPGKKERSFMLIVKILNTLIMFIERKIQTLKSMRMAKKMNGNDKDTL